MSMPTQETSFSPHPSPQSHILIIGAGITGLVLGQALQKHGIAFTIFERDPTVSARGRGWGLTIHWSLPTFISLLPQHIVDRLPEVYVDPDASARGENGNFLFFDLRSGETRWKVPPNQRIRVSRERLRALLLEGLDVQWSKALTSMTTPTPQTIKAHFSDFTTATGTLLVGADGLHSRVRSLLLAHTPHLAVNCELPVRLLGVSVIYSSSLALKMRALDPFFFQGGDPASDVFMWFSFLDTPTNNSRPPEERDTYECQILLSWPYRPGFAGQEQPLDVPVSDEERLALMKRLVEGWAEPFRECVTRIPEGTEVKTIRLEDFVPRVGMWESKQGRVTMLGDAAHAMTMFRGEGANHGITDVSILLSNILPVFSRSPREDIIASTDTPDAAIEAYEVEMIHRTAPAVLASRHACLDAHNYTRITEQSPLVSRRAVVLEE
ncbi:hypothetical protein B0A49_04234 [Cryomyces minteri]|uniref:FAD-binding domain-containing protein n=1 Tax=Cryomyces minteri TaxID=331657 RepID=A0A4U0X7Q1_9PEZI|nr:hypothetical protein B0A49_04234 [Cryomyces minteri]